MGEYIWYIPGVVSVICLVVMGVYIVGRIFGAGVGKSLMNLKKENKRNETK